jgi:hypothetical protein
MRPHDGIDLRAQPGTPVLAAGDGRVARIGNDPKGYGIYLDIDHGDGLTTRYAHLDTVRVGLNQKVEAGRVIARSGNTGRTTGPHLHFEVREDGKPRHPQNYLAQLQQRPAGVAAAFANSAGRILDRLGQTDRDGVRRFRGNTYTIERRGDQLSVQRQGNEILRTAGGRVTVDRIGAADVTSLGGAAYALERGGKPQHPNYDGQGRMNADLQATLTTNAAHTYLDRKPTHTSGSQRYYLGSDYDFFQEGGQLRVFAHDGRGELLRVEGDQIRLNHLTAQDVQKLVQAEAKLREQTHDAQRTSVRNGPPAHTRRATQLER